MSDNEAIRLAVRRIGLLLRSLNLSTMQLAGIFFEEDPVKRAEQVRDFTIEAIKLNEEIKAAIEQIEGLL